MFKVPVTFLAVCNAECEEARREVMAEFAAAGAKHLVLSSEFISVIMKDHRFAGILTKDMADFDLSFMDAHSPFGGVLDLNCPDKDFRPQMLLRHKMAIRIAAQAGVNSITIHPGSDRFFPEIPLDEHIALMRDGIDQILPEAEKCGVTVCIENSMSRAACPREITGIIKNYDTPFLGLCYDSGHAHQLDAARFLNDSVIHKFWQTVGCNEPEWDDQALERMLNNVVNCHLHDNDGSGDHHSIPGSGTIDWQKIIPLLNRAPKLRVIQCEVLKKSGESAAEICRAFEKLAAID